MRHADNKSSASSKIESPQGVAAHAVPTIFATDLMEKLIVESDALAVRKIVTAGRHH